MHKIALYRYIRPDGGVTVSPVKPETEYTESIRLVADEGMILTDGTEYTYCIDVDSPDGWTEIQDQGDIGFNGASEDDYIDALRKLGVNA